MTPELAYFLKINIAIALFYAFYRLFFYRDTFFQWRRTVLLCFLVISPLYPVLNIQEWIRSHEPMVAMVDLYATIVLPEIEITPEVRAADWQSIILSSKYHLLVRGHFTFSTFLRSACQYSTVTSSLPERSDRRNTRLSAG